MDLFSQESPIPVEESNELTRSSSFSLSNDLSSMLISSRTLPSQREISDEEANDRIAVRFLVKRSRRFGGPARNTSVDESHKNHIRNLMSRMTDSVKSTISSGLPKTKITTTMNSSLVSSLKIQGLPECLQYLGLDNNTGSRGIKRKEDFKDDMPAKRAHTREYGAILKSKMEPSERTDSEFIKPKTYECGYCNASYYHVSLYFKHIRKHKKFLRCDACNKGYRSLMSKRKHEVRCVNRGSLYG